MKKLILVFVAIVIGAGAYAQTDSTNRKLSHMDMNKYHNQNMQTSPVDQTHPDGIMMRNGKILVVKKGKMTILDKDMTMSNGTIIQSDGTYIKKDGTTMMMKEGQHVDMSGNIISVKTNKEKNMDLVPDSTKN